MKQVSENTDEKKRKSRAKSRQGTGSKKDAAKAQSPTAKKDVEAKQKAKAKAKLQAAAKQKAAKKKRDAAKKNAAAKQKLEGKQKTLVMPRAEKRKNAAQKVKLEPRLKEQPGSVVDYIEAKLRLEDTLSQLLGIAGGSRSPNKVEVIKLLMTLVQDIEMLLRHVPLDSIEILNPHEVMNCIKQMEDDGYLKFRDSKMARILLKSCVFESRVVVSERILSEWLKRR